MPQGIDILIIHGPPLARLVLKSGCPHLLQTLCRIQPKLNVFGHIHEGAGVEWATFSHLQAAYEHTVSSGGSFKNILYAARGFFMGYSDLAVEAKCLLVNPSIVGGLRDTERRELVKVLI